MSKIKTLPGALSLRDKQYSIPALHAEVPVEFEIEDVLVPAAWAHHAAKVRKGHEIVARRADLAWRVHLQVTEVGVGYVKVHVLHRWENPEHKPMVSDTDESPLPELPENYKVYAAGRGGWMVKTIDPDMSVASNLPSRRAAYLAAVDHAKKAGLLAE